MNQTLRIGAFALMTCAAGVALGQTAVPGIPPPPTITVPPPPCGDRPGTTAGLGADTARTKRWVKERDAYKKCVVDYAGSLAEEAKAYNAVAKQLVDAQAQVIADFNAYAAQVRKDNDADDE